MKIYKNRGFIYADYVLNYLGNYIERDDIYCHVDAFNNCREQGYIVTVHYEDRCKWEDGKAEGLTLYLYNNRWSDEPSVTWENFASYDKLYSEEAWAERTKTFEHIEDLVIFVEKLIEENFKEGEE